MKGAEDSVNVRRDSFLVSDDVIVDGGDLRNTHLLFECFLYVFFRITYTRTSLADNKVFLPSSQGVTICQKRAHEL